MLLRRAASYRWRPESWPTPAYKTPRAPQSGQGGRGSLIRSGVAPGGDLGASRFYSVRVPLGEDASGAILLASVPAACWAAQGYATPLTLSLHSDGQPASLSIDLACPAGALEGAGVASPGSMLASLPSEQPVSIQFPIKASEVKQQAPPQTPEQKKAGERREGRTQDCMGWAQLRWNCWLPGTWIPGRQPATRWRRGNSSQSLSLFVELLCRLQNWREDAEECDRPQRCRTLTPVAYIPYFTPCCRGRSCSSRGRCGREVVARSSSSPETKAGGRKQDLVAEELDDAHPRGPHGERGSRAAWAHTEVGVARV